MRVCIESRTTDRRYYAFEEYRLFSGSLLCFQSTITHVRWIMALSGVIQTIGSSSFDKFHRNRSYIIPGKS